MERFTKEELLSSKEYSEWVNNDDVVIIHNCYYDSKEGYAAYIVIEEDEDANYTITRFFRTEGRSTIYASVDHQGKTAHQVMELLLSDYTRGLE